MKNKLLISLIIGFGIKANALEDLKAMDRKIDIQKFMGAWYVIASIPTYFEEDANNAVETYTWNATEDRIDVDFKFNKGSHQGPQKNMTQKGWIYNKETNAEWRVQPLWPLKFAYLIVDVADDYSYTIIGVPNRNYVWIMAREPQMKDELYKSLTDKVSAMGYDMKKLMKVPQVWGPQ